ncbi:MAG: hypothetical protein ACE15C_21445 [Phycisphaerae bacterium]
MLLEVVLALALFFMSAAVIGGSVSTSLDAARRIRIDAQAADLAVTKLSELQMGLREVIDDGPNPYAEEEHLPDWTWQIATNPIDNTAVLQGPPLKRVEIIIRNTTGNYAYRLVHVLPSAADTTGSESPPDAMTGGGG